MAISIHSEDIERDACQLASYLGVNITEAIGIAVRNELGRLDRLRQMQHIADVMSSIPILDYDKFGIPN